MVRDRRPSEKELVNLVERSAPDKPSVTRLVPVRLRTEQIHRWQALNGTTSYLIR